MPERAIAAGFGNALRSWRRLNNLNQSTLAHRLGVSQPAVARWEKGLDLPAPARLSQIRDMMAKTARDEAAIQSLYVSRQSAVRALIDFDQMQLLTVSEGFRHLWPDTSLLLGISMRDRLVDEANLICNDPEIRREIVAGAVGLISGVSQRQTDLETDSATRHRWHICFRRYGATLIADMAYEHGTCAATGISEIVRFDSSGSLHDA